MVGGMQAQIDPNAVQLRAEPHTLPAQLSAFATGQVVAPCKACAWGGQVASWLAAASGGPVPPPRKRYGSLLKDNGKYGFIKQDSGEADLFVIASACTAFGGILPSAGTRLEYEVFVDPKTGRPRAERVKSNALRDGNMHHAANLMNPFGGISFSAAATFADSTATAAAFSALAPLAQQAPPPPPPPQQAPAQVPIVPPAPVMPPPLAAAPALTVLAQGRTGAMLQEMKRESVTFGFIKQDIGEDNLLVVPPSCHAFGGHLPPIGARLTYDVVMDNGGQRPRAENVQLDLRLGACGGLMAAATAGTHVGTIGVGGTARSSPY